MFLLRITLSIHLGVVYTCLPLVNNEGQTELQSGCNTSNTPEQHVSFSHLRTHQYLVLCLFQFSHCDVEKAVNTIKNLLIVSVSSRQSWTPNFVSLALWYFQKCFRFSASSQMASHCALKFGKYPEGNICFLSFQYLRSSSSMCLSSSPEPSKNMLLIYLMQMIVVVLSGRTGLP